MASDLDTVIERIQTLAVPDDGDDDPPPSSTLIARAVDLCQDAAVLMACPFPRAAASRDEHGDMSLYWLRPRQRAVSVVLHDTEAERDFLYHRETHGQSDIERPLTPELLARWLDWYTEANGDARSVDSG